MKALSLLLLFLLLICSSCGAVSGAYTVIARRQSGLPWISSQIPLHKVGHSSFDYNYNTAYCPLIDALLVRSQDSNGSRYGVKASVLTLTSRTMPYVDNSSVVFASQGEGENYGVEDPRVVWDEEGELFWLTYTAAQSYPNGTVFARLALASSPNGKKWTRHGPMFGSGRLSKSGAIVLRKGFAPIMIWGDSSLVPGLQLARPANASNLAQGWIVDESIYFPTRKGSWDSALVEAGPPPMKLRDGNLLWIYNSAQAGFPSPKPGYDLEYNIGWAILNGTDPNLAVLERCSTPLLSPDLVWEKGLPPFLGLTPNVVFANGLMRVKSGGDETFTLFYGGADSVLGQADIIVQTKKVLKRKE